MANLLPVRKPGLPLKAAGGLPRPVGPVDPPTGLALLPRGSQIVAKKDPERDQYAALARDLSPSLAAILRPQAAYRWLLPYLASITPQYIESVLRGALAGNHVQQWELFDLMIDSDPEISACVQEYVEGVLNHKVQISPYREEDEEPSDTAVEKARLVSAALRNMRPDPANDENDLAGTMRDIIFARFFGNSVLEVDWSDTYGSQKLNVKTFPKIGRMLAPRATYWVHPVCYAYSIMGRLGLRMAVARDDVPGMSQTALGRKFAGAMTMQGTEPPAWNWITSQPRPDELVDFPPEKFLIATFKSKAGTALGGSCLRALAFWWCCSNFSADYLMNYAQLFGIPFRKASYAPSTPEETKAEIRQMLQSCGSAGYMLLPEGAELEFIEASSGAGQSPQAFLAQYADTQKRKVILHQTMTGGGHDSMGKGGGKAFGQTEQDVKSACIGTGCRFVESVVNLQLVPSILRMNYPPDGADMESPVFALVDDEVGGLPDAQRDQVLVQFMDIPDSYLHSKYRIPKPAAGDQVAGQDVGLLAVQQQQAQDKMDQDQANVEADRKQADNHAKMNAEALAKQPKAPQPGQQQAPGQQQKQPAASDGGESQARRAVKAADAGPTGKGCLMAMVPESEADAIVDYARSLVEPGTLAADGVEVEPHVTSLYGFNLGFAGANGDQLREFLKGRGRITFKLGKVSRFECPDYDVLKVDVSSPELEELHADLADEFRADITPSQHEYHPHLTLAYVQKGSNRGADGAAGLEGREFTVGNLLYSEPDHSNRTTVQLTARRGGVQFQAGEVEGAAAALREAVAPMLKRLEAIDKVKDRTTRIRLMKKFLADHGEVLEAMRHDDSLAKAMAPAVVKRLMRGLQRKGK